MIRSLYTVNRSMNVLQKKQENTSGNISNSNTPGYKFRNMMQSTLEPYEMVNYTSGKDRNKRQVLGEFIFGNRIDESVTDIGQGSLHKSDNFTDFAINGDGFFTVELLTGGRGYTRNGNFKISIDGELVTQSGERVLGIDNNSSIGPIYVGSDLQVGSSGDIIGSPSRLLISEFNNYDSVIDMGNTIFTTNAGVTEIGGTEIMQNYLESSNVDFTKEIIDLIQLSREFESNQKMIQAADETLSKAVNEIGRL